MSGERVVDTFICCEDPVSLQFLEAMLRSSGFTVEAFSHVSEAIHPCLRRRYKVAILWLGYFEGPSVEEKLETLRVIRQIDPLIPRVVICDQQSLQIERRLRAEGIFYFVTKPVSAHELCDAVSCALSKCEKNTTQ
jgi:DNA-binding NtrC family response regulator